MKDLVSFLINHWLLLATIMSIFWGIRSTILFARQREFFWKTYQFIFNFVGSFAGWFCFYVLLIRVQNNFPDFRSLELGDIFLFVVSLLGLTGHLPQVTYGFIEGFAKLAEKAVEKISK